MYLIKELAPSRPALVMLMLWIILVQISTPDSMEASPWPQFRGPTRNGDAGVAGKLCEWPSKGLREIWRRSIGPGYSSVAISDGVLFTMESDQSKEYALALSAQSGEVLWRAQVGQTLTTSWGSGPRSTPAVSSSLVFFLGSVGNLTAVDRDTGQVIWAVDFQEEFGAPVPDWGFSSSPLVLDDLVIVQPGGSDHSMAALDHDTGRTRWATASDPPGYASPTLGGEDSTFPQVIFLTPMRIVSLSLDGSILWTFPFRNSNGIAPATPIFVAPSSLFVSASYGAGAALIDTQAIGSKHTAVSRWRNRLFRNHFNSSVVSDQHAYGFDNATLRCIALSNGESRWAHRDRFGKGSLIKVGSNLVILTEFGDLVVIEESPTRYREVGRQKVFKGRSWTEPSFAGGLLVVRNSSEIAALQLDLATTCAPDETQESPTLPSQTDTTTNLADSNATTLARVVSTFSANFAGPRSNEVGSLTLEGEFLFNGISHQLTIYHKRPAMFRMEVDVNGSTIVNATDGKVGWEALGPAMDKVRKLEDPEVVRLLEEWAAFESPLVAYEQKGHTVTFNGLETVDGEDLYTLEFYLNSGRSETWYLSTDNLELRRRESEETRPNWGDYKRVWTYSKYKYLHDLAIATQIDREDIQFVRTYRINKISINPLIDDAMFAPPAQLQR